MGLTRDRLLRGGPFGGTGLLLGMKILQNALHAIFVLDALIEPELDVRDAPELKPPADLPPQEGKGPAQGARRLGARRRVAERRVVHARELQVGGHLHARDRHEPDPGIVHLALQKAAKLLPNLLGDAIGTMTLGHLQTARGLRLTA